MSRRTKEEDKAFLAAGPLIDLLEDTISGLDAASELVGSFYDDGAGGAEKELFQHIRQLEQRLKKMDEKRDVLRDLGDSGKVPLDLLDHVDRVEKCNPDIYTRHKVEFALEERLRLDRINADFDAIASCLAQDAMSVDKQ